MKLAEALQERADLNRRMEQLKRRLTSNALVQEGERPAEEPAELLAELTAAPPGWSCSWPKSTEPTAPPWWTG